MERFIGIDVHKDSCTVVVMGPSGRRIRRDVVETNGAALIDVLKVIPGDRRVCIEEAGQSEWLCEILKPYAAEIVVEGTTDKKDRSQPKNDGRDAWAVAERLRTGTVKNRLTKPPREMSRLRDAVRTYGIVVGDLVRVKNRLNAVFRSRGIAIEGREVYGKKHREEYLAQLPEGRRALADVLTQEMDSLEALKADAEELLEKAAESYPAVARLTTAPGFGPFEPRKWWQ